MTEASGDAATALDIAYKVLGGIHERTRTGDV